MVLFFWLTNLFLDVDKDVTASSLHSTAMKNQSQKKSMSAVVNVLVVACVQFEAPPTHLRSPQNDIREDKLRSGASEEGKLRTSPWTGTGHPHMPSTKLLTFSFSDPGRETCTSFILWSTTRTGASRTS